jgi:MacB-like periplasmic core domain/FtsX-like permease family
LQRAGFGILPKRTFPVRCHWFHRVLSQRKFANAERVRQHATSVRSPDSLNRVYQMRDVRYAFRQLLRQPGFTILAVVALALGIGANTVLFSAINTLFLRPLSYPKPEQLVRVWGSFPERGLDRANVSWPRFTSWRDQQQSFTEFSAQSFTGFTLTGRGDPENLNGVRVTENFFRALAVQPLFGRVFNPDEDRPGGANVAVLSHTFWQKRFGGDQNVLGQSITLNGAPFTVIGVMPPSLKFPFVQTQVFIPRVFEQEGLPPDIIERGTGFLTILARMKPGVTREQADQQMHVIDRRYQTANPDKVDAKAGISVVSFHEDLVGQQRTIHQKDGADDEHERERHFRDEQPRAQSPGLSAGRAARRILQRVDRIAPRSVQRRHETKDDPGYQGKADGKYEHVDVERDLANARQEILRDFLQQIETPDREQHSENTGDGSGQDAFRQELEDDSGPSGAERSPDCNFLPARREACQQKICDVRATDEEHATNRREKGQQHRFRRLQNVDPGFRAQAITTFFVGLPPGSYPDIERQALFFQNALEKVRALPGITSAAAASTLPATGNGSTRSPAAVEGRPLPAVSDRAIAVRSTISPGFLGTLGIPIKEGRDFTWQDKSSSPLVVIINETMAKKLFPGENPVGHRLITGIASIPREIVGVSGDVRAENLSLPPGIEMYYPSTQLDGAFQSIVVRSDRSAASLRPELIAAIHSLDAGLPIDQVQSYNEVLSEASADRRLSMYLLGGFAGLALALAGMGIYSVIAYGVAQRTNEFGIRFALGAAARDVIGLVMREGLRLSVVGLVVGLGLSFVVTRLMQRLLFEVSPRDPWLYSGVALFICGIAALACFVPAMRATRIDPMQALRTE